VDESSGDTLPELAVLGVPPNPNPNPNPNPDAGPSGVQRAG
jgi:hypothetical protein